MKLVVWTIWSALALSSIQPAWADAAGDERYLRLEQASQVYEQILEYGTLDGPIIEVGDRRDLPALIVRGRTTLAETFDRATAEAEWGKALSGVQGEVPMEFEAIADRMRMIQDDLGRKSSEELQTLQREWSARYEARPDRAEIDAVSAAMATPSLMAEAALTGRRVKWAYEAVLTIDLAAFRQLSPEMRSGGLREVLEATRVPEEPGYTTPLNVELARQRQQGVAQAVLMQLPEADVAVLARFYKSDGGRAKRDALVAAFRDQNDRDGEAFLHRLLDEAANGPLD